MNPGEPTDQAPPDTRTTPPDPRPRPATTHGALLGHLILHSAFHRPR
ncbi:hypothetical protein IU450_16100 [Nocardia abscessus]|nr:hypothetical protein [Nocardia abscessus]MBF6337408.1 hypothetical protein [Nocardia abscessus]